MLSSPWQKFSIWPQIVLTFILLHIIFIPLIQASKHCLPENNFQYTVGFKDVLEITVYGHDDLHQLVSVAEDGFISFPLIGKLQVAGKTVLQIADELKARLEKEYLYSAQVEVVVKEYRSKKITLLGEIENPGIHYIKGNAKLLDVLAQMNYNYSEDKSFTKLIVQKHDQDGITLKETTIDLHKLLIEKDQSLNILLENNDKIIFRKSSKITILGMVNKPGIYDITSNTAILNAIAIAGGFIPEADPKKVIILREVDGKKQRIVIDVEKITEEPNNKDNILLRPQDYIIVQDESGGRGFVLFDYLKVIPSLTIQERYYDNVFAKRENIVSDYMLLVNPSTKLSLPFRSHNVNLTYSLGIPRFQRNPSLNNLQHNLLTELNLDFPNRLSVDFENNYTTSFIRSTAGRVIEEIGIIDSTFKRNVTSIIAKKIFSKRYSIQSSFQHENFFFSNKELGKDYISNIFSSLIGYELSPRLSLEMEYELDNTNFTRSFINEDSISHTGSLILNWQKSPRTKARMKIGYKSIEIGGGFVQFHNPVFQIRVENIFSPFSNINFQINRDLVQPILTNRLLLIATGFDTTFSKRFAKKIGLTFSAFYHYNILPELAIDNLPGVFEKKRINLWRINSKISYNIVNRVSLAFNYNFASRDVEKSISDVKQNTYSVQVIFKY